MTKIMIATLGYRNYGHAIASHLDAAAAFQQRFDWMYAWGMPEGLTKRVDQTDLDFGHEVVTRKYQDLQRSFLAGDYDVFIAIEDDMVIPRDTFSRLLNVLDNGADVAYGLYVWRHQFETGGGWSAYAKLDDNFGESIIKDRVTAARAFEDREIRETYGVGMGCTAIKRKVLKAIPFERRERTNGDPAACNDWYFAADCQKHGFVQKHDFGLVCGHMTLDPSPCIVYPSIDNELMQRVEYL